MTEIEQLRREFQNLDDSHRRREDIICNLHNDLKHKTDKIEQLRARLEAAEASAATWGRYAAIAIQKAARVEDRLETARKALEDLKCDCAQAESKERLLGPVTARLKIESTLAQIGAERTGPVKGYRVDTQKEVLVCRKCEACEFAFDHPGHSEIRKIMQQHAAECGAERTGASDTERLEYNQRKGFWTFDNGATAFDTKEEAEAAMSAEREDK